ncbi:MULTISPECIES: S-layer homology domain-containing protein [Thermoanaerobacterium]|uniref:S-layer protein n=2 Tax=Thermoanaerobacterium TaxID=28895 RepID=W9EC15_9THEO|nr:MULTISPECIES: S-layer homology domain-containing protein [Thermoanaerobacterium]AFK85894.1 S-layer domain-containing protein [Thermoanaerobacterium saccharolyticum JW/SL-YS485]ETO38766.1 S-layer protein [Thermoanaerobacterium aotearoense SCUT27]
MKKFILFIFILLFVIGTSVTAFAADFYGVQDFYKYTEPDGPFYWAYPDLELAVASEMITGYPANPPTMEHDYVFAGTVTDNVIGTLKPENTITRAEFASMLARALGLDTTALTNPFNDVKTTDWYYTPVSELVNKNIIPLDYYNGTLNPNGNITREEIAIWLANAASSYQVPLANVPLTFSDFSNTDRYAPAVADAVGLKIVSGYPDNTFRPKNTANRAEAAVMLMRLMRVLPSDLTQDEALNVIKNAEQGIAKFSQSWVSDATVLNDIFNVKDGKPTGITKGFHNSKIDDAIQDFQNTMKDYITIYNLYPESEPTLIQDNYMKNPNKDNFEPNLNQYIYKYWDIGYSYMFGKDAPVGHLGPKAYYQYGPRVEYGILGNILGRGGSLPNGNYVMPFGQVFYVLNSYQIIHMTTMGNIASVYYSRLEEANRPGFKIQMEWQRTYQHALLVKQDGKWKWAAYDPLYSNNSDATQQDNTGSWLEAFKDKL